MKDYNKKLTKLFQTLPHGSKDWNRLTDIDCEQDYLDEVADEEEYKEWLKTKGNSSSKKVLDKYYMNKQAFVNGFIKRAEEYGIPHSKAIDLIKQAIPNDEEDARFSHSHKQNDSNMGGRYLDMKALRGQTMLEHPFQSTAGGAVGLGATTGLGALLGGGVGALNSSRDWDPGQMAAGGAAGASLGGLLGYYGGAYGGISQAGNALASQGFNKEDRNKELNKSDEKLSRRSTIGNATKSGLKMIPLGALLGALGGGAIGAGVGHLPNIDSDGSLKSILSGAGIGAGLIGTSTGLAGGLMGGINSLIHKNTSPETHARSKQMLRNHPIGTALPFGDLVGAHDG